jgi:hypothetical protein
MWRGIRADPSAVVAQQLGLKLHALVGLRVSRLGSQGSGSMPWGLGFTVYGQESRFRV